MTEADQAVEPYQVEPSWSYKFKITEAQQILQMALKGRLSAATYHPENCSMWAKEIADDVKSELKQKNWPRYKYVVHVIIGEQKGEGVTLTCRCFWDQNTDALARETFENPSIFAVATCYGVYLY